MEGLFFLKNILQKNDYMCNIDLKDAYFAFPLHSSSQKYIRFKWKGNLYQFLCLCFDLSSAPRMLTKLMIIPILLKRKLNVRLITFLNDILIMNQQERNLFNWGKKQIFVTSMPDFTVSRLGNKSQRNECIKKRRTKLFHNVKTF